MVNAIISDAEIGYAEGNLYVGFTFVVKGKEQETQTIVTQPIFLVGQNEDIRSSSAAYTLLLFLDVVGVIAWSALKDKAVQIEVDANGNITKIANLLDESRFVTLGYTETPEEAAPVIEEIPTVEAEAVED